MATNRVPLALKVRCMQLVLDEHQSVSTVARWLGCTRKTVHKWLARYQDQGLAGLRDRSTRPGRSPTRLADRTVHRILRLRQQQRWGPRRIADAAGVSPASVYRVLCVHGVQHLTPKTPRVVRRYEKTAPGELLHLDTKTLVPLQPKTPTQHQFAVVDDFSREVFSRIVPRATTQAATAFLLAALDYYPYPVDALMTDNALCFTMRFAHHAGRQPLFAQTCAALGIRHQLIRPRRPETNGKIERWFRTVTEECYRRHRFRDPRHRAIALSNYVRHYNRYRPHSALGGLTPLERRTQYFESVTEVLN